MLDRESRAERIGVVIAVVLLLAAALGLFPSCVTAGELDSIRASISEVREAVDAGLVDCEKLEAVERELEHTEAETARLAEQARERAWSLADRVAGLALALTGLGGTGWLATRTAAKKVNAERDARRKDRGEPT